MGEVATAAAAAPAAIAAEPPVASTRLWCPICKRPKAYSNKPVAATSRQSVRGFHGEHLVCGGCSTTIATCYVEESADG